MKPTKTLEENKLKAKRTKRIRVMVEKMKKKKRLLVQLVQRLKCLARAVNSVCSL